MKDIENDLSAEVKLNTLVQSIYKESIEMGFKGPDYVKLMNELLDLTINNKKVPNDGESKKVLTDKFNSDLPISTENLTIRHYNSRIDKKKISKWFDEETNSLFLLSTGASNNIEIDNFVSDDKNIFAVITLKNKIPIGLLALINIDRKNNKGEMRKMIGEISERGKGYAKEASNIWLRYCTEYLGLNKIYINTIETNVKNISLNRQLGFKIEGLLKKEFVIDGIEQDVLRMAYFKK